MFRPEIISMSPYTPGEQPQAGKVIKLNTNENPYPPSPRVLEAITAAAQRLERYPDPLATSFRLAASQVLGVDPEMILCGNGSDDCLTILTRAFVGAGDRLRLPYPSYILYRTLAEIQGADFEEVPFTSTLGISEAFYQDAPRTKLIYLPNPNSPTGTLLSSDVIAEFADRVSCPVVIDEAYVDFAAENAVRLVQRNPRIIITRTLSKSYALAGLRFGYLIAHPKVVAMLRKVKDSYNTDMLSIAGATAAIMDQTWLTENVRRVIATRERMKIALRSMGFEVLDSHANFLWCVPKDRQSKPIYDQLKSRGILVRYMNYPKWADGLRISVGTEDQIDALLVVLKDIVNK
ncbi:MAG: histidinol-phosphate transaminase [Planctomycetes bacterium]|nr:histidinol-phosphate transaminase [Planctomycetota bacterium]